MSINIELSIKYKFLNFVLFLRRVTWDTIIIILQIEWYEL